MDQGDRSPNLTVSMRQRLVDEPPNAIEWKPGGGEGGFEDLLRCPAEEPLGWKDLLQDQVTVVDELHDLLGCWDEGLLCRRERIGIVWLTIARAAIADRRANLADESRVVAVVVKGRPREDVHDHVRAIGASQATPK